jgi:predicted transcriptional regulator of viral defense system
MMTKIEILLSAAPQTVFTINDLGVLWQIPERHKLARLVNYYVRTGRLYSVRRGVYALNEDYSPHEAAVKLFPPAYISYTTALGLHGAYFQYERDIHAMARASKTIQLPGGQVYVYHQLKDAILLNRDGIEKHDGFWLATLERAICDTSHLAPGFAFEHLDRADPKKLQALAAIYGNQSLRKRIQAISAEIEADQSRGSSNA